MRGNLPLTLIPFIRGDNKGEKVGKLRARQLRMNQTDAEKKLWLVLRNKQLKNQKFRRQEPVGKCIVDFICYSEKLVIELDGSQHYDSKRDVERTEWLKSQGFRVLRFWNNEVLKNVDVVKLVICENLAAPSSLPSPTWGEGNIGTGKENDKGKRPNKL